MPCILHFINKYIDARFAYMYIKKGISTNSNNVSGNPLYLFTLFNYFVSKIY